MQLSLLEPMKACRTCGIAKSLAEYHRLASSKDGRQPRCKECVAAYMRDYHVRNGEHIRAKVAHWNTENRERKRDLDREASKRFNARAKVERHTAKANLVRTCEECGSPLSPEKFLSARYCSEACQRKEARRRRRRVNPEGVAAAGKRYRQNNRDSLRRKDHRRRARRRAAFVEDVHPLVVLEAADGVCGICGDDVDPEDFHVDHVIPLSRGGEHSYANVQPAHPRCNLLKNDEL